MENKSKKDFKLKVELVPNSCWYSNLRSLLKPSDWDIVRKDAYARAEGRCMTCGRKVKRLEAHERWLYDEQKAVQKLTDVVALCHSCHECVHLGRTTLMGREKEACSWFMKVNGCSYTDYLHHVGEANKDHARRNLVNEWSLDLTFLQRHLLKSFKV